MPNRRFSSALCLTLSVLLPLLFCTRIAAQEPDPEVRSDLEQIEDESKPIEYRAQLVSRLLAGEEPAAVDGLRRMLLAEGTSRELRLAIVSAVLGGTRFSLLNDVLDLVTASREPDLVEEIHKRFRWGRSKGLVRRLFVIASDKNARLPMRLLAVKALGSTEHHAAVEALVDLWGTGDPAEVAAAAPESLYRVLPVRFTGPEEAKEWWAKNKTKDLETILREILRELAARTGNGQDPESVAREYVAHAKAGLERAPLSHLLASYLGSRIPEIRNLGAGRLTTYPFVAREGKKAAPEARKRAAQGVLDALGGETDPAVSVSLLGAIGSLADGAKAADTDRTLALLTGRLDDPRREVALAAVKALGSLGDRRVVEPHLCRRYDELAAEDPELRLAILDAIESCGNGIADWVLVRLGGEEKEERITIRLFKLLQSYDDPSKRPDCIPAVIAILESKERGARIRQEAATTLGALMGAKESDKRAVKALATAGLTDEDPSVRVIAVTMIGRAKPVDDEVIGQLRLHLGSEETDAGVRRAAARAILKLRRVAAVSYLKDHLGDDALWQDAVLNFLVADIFANGKTLEAVGFVKALHEAGAAARCVEVARLVLAANELRWEGEGGAGRGEVSFCLARALGAVGEDEEALAVLDADVPEKLPTDPRGFERALVRARLLRKTGAPDKVEQVLQTILGAEEKPPEDVQKRATLERAHALIALGEFDKAQEALKLLAEDAEYGERAAELIRLAKEGRARRPPAGEPGTEKDVDALAKMLDGEDAEARKTAVEALKEMGKEAHPALLAWLEKKEPEEIPAALETIRAITGRTVTYDPAAPEEERKKALEDLRALLAS